MQSTFKYFFWGSPVEETPLFALYDVFDNHFMIQSYNYSHLFAIRKLIRSKTVLDIVELTNVPNLLENNLIDNSVVENWGLESMHIDLFRDATPRWKNQNDEKIFYETAVIKDPVLKQVDSKFDDFKIDLQKQIFFIHYCLETTNSNNVKNHLQKSIELGKNYNDVIDKFLNFSDINDLESKQDMFYFLRFNNLFYE